MKNKFFLLSIIYAFFMTNETEVKSQTVDRSTVATKYTWKLEDIYATDADWQQDKEKVKSDVDHFETFKGKLGSSSKTLLEYLQFSSEFNKRFTKVYCYASMKSDQDIRDTKYMGMLQELRQLEPTVGAKTSFAEPELLALGKETIDKFIAEQKDLGVYKMYLQELIRQKAHLLSEKEERIMALSASMAGSPSSIYKVFSNTELPYPLAKLSNGETVKLDQAGYSKYRAVANRSDRELVFKTYMSALKSFQATFAEQLLANVNAHIFGARARNYSSCLERALDPNNIPVSVYHSLIDNVNKNLPVFHRYLALRKRMLGLDTLKYSDMYASVVKNVELNYKYDEAQKIIVDALSPLGKDYQSVIKKAFDERWLDVYPTTGKRSGAYSQGSVYDVHPYMLLNYNGEYNDVSTTAHELGHTMQSYYSNKTQPFPLADYPIFTAEVASTFNEDLLNSYMVARIKDDNTKLSLLMSRLDGFKGTLFRQTQFAEFELRIHEKAEAGQPLTADVMNKIYGDILRKYYGNDKGVCVIDDLYSIEWAFIPHFYYNFYVYQYATSFTASSALAEKVMTNEKGALEKYLQFISAGGSDYPIELLKKAGVDMTTSEPFDKAIASMNHIMDEIEAILKKQGK